MLYKTISVVLVVLYTTSELSLVTSQEDEKLLEKCNQLAKQIGELGKQTAKNPENQDLKMKASRAHHEFEELECDELNNFNDLWAILVMAEEKNWIEEQGVGGYCEALEEESEKLKQDMKGKVFSFKRKDEGKKILKIKDDIFRKFDCQNVLKSMKNA